MPQVLPSRAELARMTPAQRAKARRAIWAILAETDVHIERESKRRDPAVAFGQAVRERARLLERYAPRDPAYVTAERRRILIEATS